MCLMCFLFGLCIYISVFFLYCYMFYVSVFIVPLSPDFWCSYVSSVSWSFPWFQISGLFPDPWSSCIFSNLTIISQSHNYVPFCSLPVRSYPALTSLIAICSYLLACKKCLRPGLVECSLIRVFLSPSQSTVVFCIHLLWS